MANLSPDRDKKVLSHLQKTTHQTIYNGLPEDLKEVFFELMESGKVNGELTENFDKGLVEVKAFLTSSKRELDKEKTEMKKSKEEQAQRQKEENEKLNASMVELLLGMIVRKFLIMLFGLSLSPDQTHAEALEVLKDHLNFLKTKFLSPILAVHSITDENIEQQIHVLALKIMFGGMFNIPRFHISGGSTAISVYALLTALKYQESIVGFNNMSDDNSVLETMIARRVQIISSIAATYAAESGAPVEKIKSILEEHSATIMQKIKTAVLG